MPFLITLALQRMADEIEEATRRVVFACAGVQKPVADALRAAHARLPGTVKVVLDIAPGVARLGYGDFECIHPHPGSNPATFPSSGFARASMSSRTVSVPQIRRTDGHADDTHRASR